MADIGHNSGQPLSEDDKARLEVKNGERQFNQGIEMIEYYLDPHRPFSLRPHHIQELQSVAVEGLLERPGEWRDNEVKIEQSQHTPPQSYIVPMLITEMCEYVNDNWHERTPFYVASYVMWRLNWIHPFPDGNGRTARLLSYVLLNIKLGNVLQGGPSIPAQIVERRDLYLDALAVADRSLREGAEEPDLSQMEDMLRGMLARQLISIIESADSGGDVPCRVPEDR